MLSYVEEEDLTVFISCHEAAKLLAPEENSKPAVLCPLDLYMPDVCKHAAVRQSIARPAVQTDVVKSWFYRKKLPNAWKTGEQVLAVFPELLDKIAETRRDEPYIKNHPIAGSSLLDCEGRGGGLTAYTRCHLWSLWLQTTWIEQHLILPTAASLPFKMDRFQSSLTDKGNKAAALNLQHNGSQSPSPWTERLHGSSGAAMLAWVHQPDNQGEGETFLCVPSSSSHSCQSSQGEEGGSIHDPDMHQGVRESTGWRRFFNSCADHRGNYHFAGISCPRLTGTYFTLVQKGCPLWLGVAEFQCRCDPLLVLLTPSSVPEWKIFVRWYTDSHTIPYRCLVAVVLFLENPIDKAKPFSTIDIFNCYFSLSCWLWKKNSRPTFIGLSFYEKGMPQVAHVQAFCPNVGPSHCFRRFVLFSFKPLEEAEPRFLSLFASWSGLS
ncbi:hypothetical protein XENOCAPTIV_005872 [Xenoophorus captivus]|uniref:Uncharacterized protein n=1 Tax=Xenoophorus captivus TaxID=1517983 RepID=A0ABV0RFS3_9TELE